MIANGFGASIEPWYALLEKLSPHCRWLIWDYRGLFRSGRPRDLAHLGIGDHRRDIEAIIQRERIDRPFVVGWSAGVQVALELWATHRDWLRGLALVHGSLATLGDLALPAWTRLILPRRLRRSVIRRPNVFGTLANVTRPAVRPLARPRIIRPLAKSIGLVQHATPDFDQAVSTFLTQIDYRILTRMVHRATQHDVSALFNELRLPVLITAGDKDVITPPAAMQRLAQRIPTANMQLFPNSSHYVIAEQPQQLADTLIPFITQH